MSDRNDILNTLGVDVRRMLTIGPNGFAVETEQDATNLVRILDAHPHLPQALARQQDPEVEVRIQTMLEIIHRKSVEPGQQASAAARDQLTALPANPMPMSRAIEEYLKGKQATRARKARTADDKAKLTRAGGFKSGWPKLRHDHTTAQVKRLR